MRKTLLIAAAALAAGVISSQAQTVYSQNIVGYYNITIPANKLALMAIQLNDGNGSYAINTQLTNGVPNGSSLLVWNTGLGKFDTYNFYTGYGWYDQSYNLTTNGLPAGLSAYLENGDTVNPATITIVGTVPTNSITVINPGSGFYSMGSPIATNVTSTLAGFPAQNGDSYLHWSVALQTYDASYNFYTGYGWYDQSYNLAYPTPNVGEGFLYQNSGVSTNWNFNFNP
jgi:hypothetical protein